MTQLALSHKIAGGHTSGPVAMLGAVGLGVLTALILPVAHPSPAAPVRLPLVVTEVTPPFSPWSAQMRAVDRDTLVDVPGLGPLTRECVPWGRLQPGGHRAAFLGPSLAAPPTSMDDCRSSRTLNVRQLDVANWGWGSEALLADPDGFDVLPTSMSPLVWSKDGEHLYILTHSAPHDRKRQIDPSGGPYRLWILGAEGTAPTQTVTLDFAPWRLDVSPDGSRLYVLGYEPDLTQDPMNINVVARGPAFLSILDATSGAERVRIPLPHLRIGQTTNLDPVLNPASALAVDGRRYYVLHPDEAVLDVVDVFVPRYERLERTVDLDVPQRADAGPAPTWVGPGRLISNWIGVTSDKQHVYARPAAPDSAHEVGLVSIDTRSWQVQSIDPAARRSWLGRDGLRLFVLDDTRVSDTTTLRALDASGGPSDDLINGVRPDFVEVMQDDPLHAYVLVPGPDARRPPQAGSVVSQLVVFDTASMTRLAERPNIWPAVLMP